MSLQVTISSGLANRFTRGSRMMFEEAGDGNFTVGGLAYVAMSRGADGLVRPMSSDDKLRNGIFNGMCKKAWKACHDEAAEALKRDGGDLSARGMAPEAAAEVRSKREAIGLSRGLYKLSALVTEDKETAAARAKADKESRIETGKQVGTEDDD